MQKLEITLAATGATAAMNGDQFRCVVSNSAGPITSGVATLTVGTVPVITVNPQNQTVVAGNSALFFSSATGNPIPGYRWQRKPAGAAVWANLYETAGFLGTATTNLTVTGTVTLMNADQFRCVASSPAGSATSSVATLTVIPVVLPPIILSEAFVEDGNFKFVFSGQAGSAYSVQFNDGFSATPGWQHLLNLVGVGGSILVIDSISNNAARIYRVLVVP